MNEQLIRSMIRNCFYQYHYNHDSIPLSESGYMKLVRQVQARMEQKNDDVHEIVEDVVYEFLTTS